MGDPSVAVFFDFFHHKDMTFHYPLPTPFVLWKMGIHLWGPFYRTPLYGNRNRNTVFIRFVAGERKEMRWEEWKAEAEETLEDIGKAEEIMEELRKEMLEFPWIT